MIKDYSKSSLVVGHIKELLHNFNLPMVSVYVDEDKTPAIKGKIYIKGDYIVRYDGDGIFTELSSYTYNREVLNLTKKLVMNSTYYDYYTHNYLGDYLRFMRDYKNIDLMKMYNCFFSEQPVAIYKSVKLDSGKRFEIHTDSSIYNYYIVSVKFNRQYTIAIDSPVPYEVACILYDTNSIDTDDEDLIKATYSIINNTSFKRPAVYNKLVNNDLAAKMHSKERDLKLLIKLPKIVDSSIVVLEGNYSDECNVVDGALIYSLIKNDNSHDFNIVSKNSLLSYNNKISYPFADRLVEYLLGNAITSDDDISENIKRVQDDLYPKGIVGPYGVYTNRLKHDIYDQTLKRDISRGLDSEGRTIKHEGNLLTVVDSSGTDINYTRNRYRYCDTHFDTTGFIDKDIEQIISLGVSSQDE